MSTLNDQALSIDGHPIPAGKVCRVELIDSSGTVVESQDFTGVESAQELSRWAGDYVMCLASEGMEGTVRWSLESAS